MTAIQSQQQTQALVWANEVRVAVAQLRHEISDLPQLEAKALVAGLLEDFDSDEVAEKMRIGAMLISIHGIGVGTVGTWLASAGVRSVDRRVRDLSERQRSVLARLLRQSQGRRRV
jgi:hypothetical protein